MFRTSAYIKRICLYAFPCSYLPRNCLVATMQHVSVCCTSIFSFVHSTFTQFFFLKSSEILTTAIFSFQQN